MDTGLTRRCGIQSLPSGRESVAKVWQLLETEVREGENWFICYWYKNNDNWHMEDHLRQKGVEICRR